MADDAHDRLVRAADLLRHAAALLDGIASFHAATLMQMLTLEIGRLGAEAGEPDDADTAGG